MHSNVSRTVKILRGVAAGTSAAALSMAAAACGSTTAAAAKPVASGTPSVMARPATTGRIGADCGKIPAKGMGSIDAMAKDRAMTAAAQNPQLSAFVAAAKTAGVTAGFNSSHAITLFVPENSAFGALSAMTLKKLHNRDDLLKIVKYHVVGARIAPNQIAQGATVPTLEGGQVTFGGTGSVYKVNGATVLCGNIQAANATIYVINEVLTPPK